MYERNVKKITFIIPKITPNIFIFLRGMKINKDKTKGVAPIPIIEPNVPDKSLTELYFTAPTKYV